MPLIITVVPFFLITISSSCGANSTNLPNSFSRDPSLSSIAFGRSSRLLLVPARRWFMHVIAGQPTLACLCVIVYIKKTSLMCSFHLLQQCTTCLACLNWMVCEREVSGRSATVLCDDASRICFRQHATFLCRNHVDFSVMFWPFNPAKNAIQGDAPEGSDTF